MIRGFKLDIYDSDIHFAWETNDCELNNFFDKAKVPNECRQIFFERYNENNTGAITTGYPVTNMFTVFRLQPTKRSVAHEIYHIVYNILKPREIEDEEAWAYCIGYVTEMFYKLFSQKN